MGYINDTIDSLDNKIFFFLKMMQHLGFKPESFLCKEFLISTKVPTLNVI